MKNIKYQWGQLWTLVEAVIKARDFTSCRGIKNNSYFTSVFILFKNGMMR